MNKEEQKKLLIEIMEADEKDGLYKTNNMKYEKWMSGFLVGFFIGGIVGIIVLDLVQRGIL